MSDRDEPYFEPPWDVWAQQADEGHMLTVNVFYEDLERAMEAFWLGQQEPREVPPAIEIPADDVGVSCVCGATSFHEGWDDAVWWVREHLLSDGRDPKTSMAIRYLPSSPN